MISHQHLRIFLSGLIVVSPLMTLSGCGENPFPNATTAAAAATQQAAQHAAKSWEWMKTKAGEAKAWVADEASGWALSTEKSGETYLWTQVQDASGKVEQVKLRVAETWNWNVDKAKDLQKWADDNKYLVRVVSSVVVAVTVIYLTKDAKAADFTLDQLYDKQKLEKDMDKLQFKMIANQVFDLKADATNYRACFAGLTGMPPTHEAIHSMPEKYSDILARDGINIYAPQNIRGVSKEMQQPIADKWSAWETTHAAPSSKEIQDFAKSIDAEFGSKMIFYK